MQQAHGKSGTEPDAVLMLAVLDHITFATVISLRKLSSTNVRRFRRGSRGFDHAIGREGTLVVPAGEKWYLTVHMGVIAHFSMVF